MINDNVCFYYFCFSWQRTLFFWKVIEVVITARTRNAVHRQLCQGFESLTFRQSKPKSNTKVFGLGFSFAKIRVVSAFFGRRRAVVLSFSGFVWVCSYRFIRSICRRFYAAKGSWREKGVCQAILPKANEKPLGAVGWRFICLPTRSWEAHVKNTVE